MKKQVVIAPLILSLMWLAATPAVFAGRQSPAELTQSCIDDMNAKAARCCDSIDTKVNRAVPRISSLVADGKVNRATAVANRTKKSVRALRQRCDNRITSKGNSVYLALQDIGEVELASAVQTAKLGAIDAINECRDNAVDAVDAALGGGVE